MASEGNKHVLYLTRWYPSDRDSMLGLFVRNHAKAAALAGYKVTVAFIAESTVKKGKRKLTSFQKDGNLTEIITYYNRSSNFSVLKRAMATITSVSKAIGTNGKPAVIHAHILTRTAVLAMLLAAWYRIPFVITEHWSRYYDENQSFTGFLRKWLTKLVISRSAATTVVSKRLYNAMQGRGLQFKKSILPNVVDTRLFNISEQRSPLFRFISITCFEEKSKNLKLLIDAVNAIRNEGLDFELVMVGDGDDRLKIEKYVQSLSLDVTFTGTLTPEETAAILKQSHCLVLSSNYETFGIVVYEALASGIPVISTDVADLKELITEQNGKVIPVGDLTALIESMREVYKKINDYEPKRLRAGIENICSITSVSLELDKLYQRVIQ